MSVSSTSSNALRRQTVYHGSCVAGILLGGHHSAPLTCLTWLHGNGLGLPCAETSLRIRLLMMKFLVGHGSRDIRDAKCAVPQPKGAFQSPILAVHVLLPRSRALQLTCGICASLIGRLQITDSSTCHAVYISVEYPNKSADPRCVGSGCEYSQKKAVVINVVAMSAASTSNFGPNAADNLRGTRFKHEVHGCHGRRNK